ncbi:MAG: GntR family transcriptional regulator [Nitriliruptoraceae bacterium]
MMNLTDFADHGAQERRSDVPLYAQLREALRTEIRERGLRPGDRLPTEAELEERYGVSRSTIRQAVGDLEVEGLLRRVQGRGTFVGSPKIQHHPVLMSFSGLLRSQGYTPSHRLLDTTVVGASEEVAESLQLDVGTPCREIERLLSADDDPVGVSKTWLPRAVLGEHDDTITAGVTAGRSLYELLGEASPELVPARASETIDPALAGEAESELLGCEPGTPLLFIRRRSWTRSGLPLESTQLLFLPGRYQYRVELQSADAPEQPRG